MIVKHSKVIKVPNISARNAIGIKTNNMRVIVEDASADVNANGEAIYLWNSLTKEWELENPDVEESEKLILILQDEINQLKNGDLDFGDLS